jgi:hypothetical protein
MAMLKILRIRQGFNPNSSSLSVNVSVLLAATSLVTLGTFLTATAIRMFRRKPDSAGAHAHPTAPQSGTVGGREGPTS